MKRILLLISCIALLVAVLVVPASADGLDYNDYVSRVEVDGSNDVVTVTIPAELCFVRVYDYTDSSDVYTGYGASHTFEALTGHSYAFQMWPFGYPWGDVGGLDITNIPDGTSGTVSFSSNVNVGGDSEQHPATAYFTYRNENRIVVEYSYVDYTYSPGVHDFDFVVNPPSNATVLEFEDSVGFAVFDDGRYSFTVNDTVLIMSISSLYRLQQETGKTNTILAEVQKQLEANGQKLDDIINGTVKPILPNGSDGFEIHEGLEGDIRNEISGGLDESNRIHAGALEILAQYAGAFAVVAWMFNWFANIPFFSGLLYVSLALGIFASLVGIAVSFANREHYKKGD